MLILIISKIKNPPKPIQCFLKGYLTTTHTHTHTHTHTPTHTHTYAISHIHFLYAKNFTSEESRNVLLRGEEDIVRRAAKK